MSEEMEFLKAILPVVEGVIDDLQKPEGGFSTEQVEIQGISYKAFSKAPKNLREFYQTCLGEEEDKDFLVYQDERYTYKQTLQAASNLSFLLVDKFDIKKGDRVAISMRNYPEWAISYLAITSMGAIVVPMNSWWQGSEMEYALKDCGASLLICDQERHDHIEPFLPKLNLNVILVRPTHEVSGDIEIYEELIKKLGNKEIPTVEVLPDDDASIMYTSGSTGYPKGALSSHRSIISAALNFEFAYDVLEIIKPELAPPDLEKALIQTVPLFHVTGLIPMLLLSSPTTY